MIQWSTYKQSNLNPSPKGLEFDETNILLTFSSWKHLQNRLKISSDFSYQSANSNSFLFFFNKKVIIFLVIVWMWNIPQELPYLKHVVPRGWRCLERLRNLWEVESHWRQTSGLTVQSHFLSNETSWPPACGHQAFSACCWVLPAIPEQPLPLESRIQSFLPFSLAFPRVFNHSNMKCNEDISRHICHTASKLGFDSAGLQSAKTSRLLQIFYNATNE